MNDNDEIRQRVKAGYDNAARSSGSGCCGADDETRDHALEIGYDEEELEAIPEEANLGLGCGNPSAISELAEGEVVLDLGSGAGMDAFLAASKVGEEGRVIGVDMAPKMLERARNAATRRGVSQFVEFREGYIEKLPVTDESVDVILSNCVINLSPDKQRVFDEAYRVLKPGGRLAVSDICLSAPLPESVVELEEAYLACISGAESAREYIASIERAGFEQTSFERKDASALIDGACTDPVLSEAFDQVEIDDLKLVRERLWSYRFAAEKR